MTNTNLSNEITSNCCGADVLNEHDGEGICSDCHEHCAVAEEIGENEQELNHLSEMGEENL
jgi:hypothetical protein